MANFARGILLARKGNYKIKCAFSRLGKVSLRCILYASKALFNKVLVEMNILWSGLAGQLDLNEQHF